MRFRVSWHHIPDPERAVRLFNMLAQYGQVESMSYSTPNDAINPHMQYNWCSIIVQLPEGVAWSNIEPPEPLQKALRHAFNDAYEATPVNAWLGVWVSDPNNGDTWDLYSFRVN